MSVIVETASLSPLDRCRDVLALTKPRLSSLVLVTAGAGLYLAPESLSPWRAVLVLVATALLVGAANALNCHAERDIDALMRRTQGRPLPARRLEPWVALVVGWGGAAVALPLIASSSNLLTSLLGALAFFLYVFVYTPMKRVTPLALFVGAIPGAMPPLMGWTAASGRLDAGGLALFAILFAWQLPHFIAIAVYLRDDYLRAGLRICSTVWSAPRLRWAMVSSSLVLLAVSLLPAWLEMTRGAYTIASLALGTAFFALAARPRADELGRRARTIFLSSTAYLSLLFAALIFGAR